MGLTRKNAAPTEEAPMPDETTAPEAQTEKKAPAVKKKAAPAAAPATTTQASPPAVASDKKIPTIAELENVMEPEKYGNVFPRLKGSNSAIMTEENVNLGEYVDVQVMSHSPRWFVTPLSKDKEAKKFCRASYDGETIIDNETGKRITIEEYEESIDGYEFKTGKYVDVYALVIGSHKKSEEAIGLGIVQISISPTAVKTFTAFHMQTMLSVMRGLTQASHQNCMRVVAVPKNTTDGDGYTIMKFEPVPAEVTAGYVQAL